MALTRIVPWLVAVVSLAGCSGHGSPAADASSSPTPLAQDLDTGTVVGVVVDDEQVPLEGADVWIADDETRRDLTDASGRFLIPGIRPGEHELVATMAGHLPTEQVVVVRAGERTDVTLVVAAIPAPVPRSASYIAEAIIELGVNAFGIYYYDNSSGTDYRDIFYDVTPDVRSAVVGLQWTPVSPLSAKWMYLGLYLSDRQCVRVCDLVQSKEGRSPLVARGDDLDVRIADRGGALTVNPYIAIEPPCEIATITSCTQNPDAAVQAAQDQRFSIFTTVFYVEPAPPGYSPLPAP